MRVGCVMPPGAATRFNANVLTLFMLLLIVGLMHVVFVVVRHGRRFRSRSPALIGAEGTIMSLFPIGRNESPLSQLSIPRINLRTSAYAIRAAPCLNSLSGLGLSRVSIWLRWVTALFVRRVHS